MVQAIDTEVQAGRRVTWVGLFANLVLSFVKALAGVFGHSQALVADAVHSLSDLISDFVVLIGLRYGRRGADDDHHFGHARIETIASAGVGLLLVGAAVYIGYSASRDVYEHTVSHPTLLAMAGAVVSLLVKEWLYRYTVQVGRRIHSLALEANAWHHRSDALSSVAVLIGVMAAQLKDEWHILDAYAAIVVSLFILKVAVVDIMRSAVRELSDAAPDPEIVDRIHACAGSVPDVLGVHDLKVRSLGGRYQIQMHVVVDGSMTVHDGHLIANAVRDRIKQDIPKTREALVHIDPAESLEAPGEPD